MHQKRETKTKKASTVLTVGTVETVNNQPTVENGVREE